MTFTNITTPEIDVTKLTETATELLEAMVHGDASPFKDMKDILEDYLDTAPELDATQKAGIFADSLRGMYKDVNSQVISAAIEVQKVNTALELQKYSTEASYNQALVSIPKTEEDTKLVAAQIIKIEKETDVLGKEDVLKDVQIVEMRAKLKKQYGVQETVVMQLSDDAGDEFLQFTDGIWYKVNATNDFITALDIVTITPDVDGVPAKISAASLTSTLFNTTNPGAIDKQIRGYDMVNIKDTLKTLDERTALMQNAKIPESSGDKLFRKELLEGITGATITLDGDNNIIGVTDIVV